MTPLAASAPPCHSQSPENGPPTVATDCVAGSMRRTAPALLGSAKQAPHGNSRSPMTSGGTSTPRSHLNLPGKGPPISATAPVATLICSTRCADPGTP